MIAFFWAFCSMLTQFPIMEQTERHRQGRPDISDHVTARLHYITPGNVLSFLQCVRHPQKLPVRQQSVRNRSPPRSRFGMLTEQVVGNEAEEKNRRTNRQRGD